MYFRCNCRSHCGCCDGVVLIVLVLKVPFFSISSLFLSLLINLLLIHRHIYTQTRTHTSTISQILFKLLDHYRNINRGKACKSVNRANYCRPQCVYQSLPWVSPAACHRPVSRAIKASIIEFWNSEAVGIASTNPFCGA